MLLFLTSKGMAKVQIIMPVTLDGFLPDKNEELMEWLRTDRNGFPYWEERATFNIYPHYSMLDLMDAKEKHEKKSYRTICNSCVINSINCPRC